MSPTDAIDFATFSLTRRPNQFLMAPAGLCANARAHAESPRFDVPVDALRRAFLAVAGRQPRTQLLGEDGDSARFVQRSRICRFPDFIDVRFIAIDDGASTLAVYSRARYGRRDFGVNRGRIDAWMAMVAADLLKTT